MLKLSLNYSHFLRLSLLSNLPLPLFSKEGSVFIGMLIFVRFLQIFRKILPLVKISPANSTAYRFQSAHALFPTAIYYYLLMNRRNRSILAGRNVHVC